jgi:hypothetical protein
MMRQRQVFASFLLGGAVVFVLGLGALAQSVSLTVTAYSDAVRFSAQGSVKELRVEILALSGQKVFDSGPVLGNALDWKLSNTQGQPVANGVYLYTVTVKDPLGMSPRRWASSQSCGARDSRPAPQRHHRGAVGRAQTAATAADLH